MLTTNLSKMDLTSLPSSVTQIVYLVISADKDLKDKATETGTIWLQALDTIEGSAGYQRLYWGRSVEQPEKVQLHVGMFITNVTTET